MLPPRRVVDHLGRCFPVRPFASGNKRRHGRDITICILDRLEFLANATFPTVLQPIHGAIAKVIHQGRNAGSRPPRHERAKKPKLLISVDGRRTAYYSGLHSINLSLCIHGVDERLGRSVVGAGHEGIALFPEFGWVARSSGRSLPCNLISFCRENMLANSLIQCSAACRYFLPLAINGRFGALLSRVYGVLDLFESRAGRLRIKGVATSVAIYLFSNLFFLFVHSGKLFV